MGIVLVLTGCTAPAPDPFDNRGPITFVDGPDTSSGRQLAQLVDRWNEQHEYSEKVTFVEMPYATDEFRAQLRTRAQDLARANRSEHQPQCYDVVTVDVIWIAEFARAGYLAPLDPNEFHVDGYLRRPVEAVTLDGQLWAVPQRTDAGLLYYRKDLLDAAGVEPPKNWHELITQAVTIAPRYNVDGYVSQFGPYEGLTVNMAEAIWANGGDVLTPDGEILVNSPAAKAGVTMLARGVDGWIPRTALAFNEEHSREAFQRGHALFIRFVTSEANQRHLFETGGFAPTIASLYDDPGLKARFPYLDVLRRSVEGSRNRPTTAHYDDVSGAIQELLANALRNPVSAEAMTDELAERWRTSRRHGDPPRLTGP